MNVLDFNLTMFLRALQQHYRRKGYDVTYWPFFYAMDFLALGVAPAALQAQVVIEKDASFVWSHTMFTAFSTAGASITGPNVTFEIKTTTSGRSFQNAPVHLMNVAGTGQRPFYLFRPAVLSARSALTGNLVNVSATAMNVRVTLHGVKVILEKAA